MHYMLREQQSDELNARIEDSFSTLSAEMTSETGIRTHWMESVLLLLQRSVDSVALVKALESGQRRQLEQADGRFFSNTTIEQSAISYVYQAERRLELYGEAFTNTIGGMIITDRKAIIVDVNEAFERVTGYSKAEAVGHNPSMLKSGHQASGWALL